VQVDYSDLYDILTFFIGSPLPGSEGEGGHDDLAEKIAKEGKSWAETHLRLEDMMVYQARSVFKNLFHPSSNYPVILASVRRL
jgi:hypothetical protein